MRTTRETLIAVAAQLLDEGGPAAVTLREVGTRAGISHNAPYKHFTGKRDLLAAVASAELHTLADQIATAAANHPRGLDKVRACALAYIQWARAHPARFKLTFGPWGEEPHDELGRAADRAALAMDDCVAAAIADNTLRGDPHRIASMVWALGHGAIDLDLAGHLHKKPGSPTPEHLVDEFTMLLSAN